MSRAIDLIPGDTAMSNAVERMTNLSARQRQEVEALLAEFRQTWDEERLATWAKRLPDDAAVQGAALVEMAKIDLERRWQRGRPTLLETYLQSYPQLGNADVVPLDLIQAEVESRRRNGVVVDWDDFARRFPRHADALRRLGEESAGHTGGARHSTHPSGRPQGSVEPPEQFGRYRVLKKLGQGGMGAVYLAHDAQLDRQVALKVPRFAPEDGPEILERFLREARAAATMQHPNICPVYDVGQIDGIHYASMAFLDGKTLSELIRAGKLLPQRPAAAIVRKLALALEEAHGLGIIHRDLKPANVMINQRKEPVVMDFGLARRLNKEDARLTQTGDVMGTPAYMSPEQVRAADEIGPASDIYSLGVIFYEMLTGHLPFSGKSALVMAAVLTQEPDRPSKLRRDLEPGLEAICLKAMAKKPADRYGSMKDFAAALTQVLKTEEGPARPPVVPPKSVPGKKPAAPPQAGARASRETPKRGTPAPTAPPPHPTEVPPRPSGRREPHSSRPPTSPPPQDRGAGIGWLPPLIAFCLILLLVGGLWYLSTRNGKPEKPDEKRAESTDGKRDDKRKDADDVKDQKPGDNRKDDGAVARDDKPRDNDSKKDQVPSDSVKDDRPGKDKDAAPKDNDAGPRKDNVRPVDPDKPQTPVLLKGHTLGVNTLVFSPDGKTLVTGGDDKTVILWDLATRKERKNLIHPDQVTCVSFSADGKFMAVSQKSKIVTIWNLADQTRRDLDLKKEHYDGVALWPDAAVLAARCREYVSIWDVAKERELAHIPAANFFMDTSLPLVPGGNLLAVTQYANSADIAFWDRRTPAKKEVVLRGHALRVIDVAFNADGSRMASASEDKTVKVWDLAKGTVIVNLRGYDNPVQWVQFSRDDRTLVTWSHTWPRLDLRDPAGGVLKLWDAATMEELPINKTLPPAKWWHLAPDSKTLAISYHDDSVRKWFVKLFDVTTGKEIAEYKDEKGWPVRLTFSADGKYLAWVNPEGNVKLWEVGLKVDTVRADPAKGEPSEAVNALLVPLFDTDNTVRRQAAQSLEKLGDKSAVPALVKRVADDLFHGEDLLNPEIIGSKSPALKALQVLGPERVSEALIGALHSKTEGVRIWACPRLAAQKDKASAAALGEALAKDAKPDVRMAAAVALSTVRPPAVTPLVQALGDEDNGVRREAAKSLRKMADPATNRPEVIKAVADGAVPALIKRVADDRWHGEDALNPDVIGSKAPALTLLRELAPDHVTEALKAALQSKTEEVRVFACRHLAKQKDKESLEALTASLKDPSAAVRSAATKAISERK
jgi:serine/threonine protein kinase/WD40 repeat protein/HEAT repeat protein